MNTSQIDAPDFAAGFSERLSCQLHEGILRCEGEHRTKSGRLIPVEVTTSTIQYDSQIAVLAIFRDITERKALDRTRREYAESQVRNAMEMECKNRALSESEARYRQLTEASLDAIVVADDAGRIALFNPAAEKSIRLRIGARSRAAARPADSRRLRNSGTSVGRECRRGGCKRVCRDRGKRASAVRVTHRGQDRRADRP